MAVFCVAPSLPLDQLTSDDELVRLELAAQAKCQEIEEDEDEVVDEKSKIDLGEKYDDNEIVYL